MGSSVDLPSRARRPPTYPRSRSRPGATLAAVALLLAAIAPAPALAQGGGVSAPYSGGVAAPDPAPSAKPAPKPDAAPREGSGNAQANPSQPPAAPADMASGTPYTGSSPAGYEVADTRRDAGARSGRGRTRKQAKHSEHTTARDTPEPKRLAVGAERLASLFGVKLGLAIPLDGDSDGGSPPVALIGWALLTLVLAGAALLALTIRLSRIESVTQLGRPTSRSARR
jgi:hypothetical protein